MDRLKYFVVRQEEVWKIAHAGHHSGPFASQRAAIDAAIRSASDSTARGQSAQVIVQGEDNRFRTEWTYGHDPFPPKG